MSDGGNSFSFLDIITWVELVTTETHLVKYSVAESGPLVHKGPGLPVADVLAPDEGVGDGDEVPRLATPPTLLCEGVVAVDRVRAVYPHVCRTVWGGVVWAGYWMEAPHTLSGQDEGTTTVAELKKARPDRVVCSTVEDRVSRAWKIIIYQFCASHRFEIVLNIQKGKVILLLAKYIQHHEEMKMQWIYYKWLCC